MCARCDGPPVPESRPRRCDRCGHVRRTWAIHRGRFLDHWPAWREEHICYPCLAVAINSAA